MVRRDAPIMIGRRRPNRVFKRSDQYPTRGGTAVDSTPPRPTARPRAEFFSPDGTTDLISVWIKRVVTGIQRKLLPNQKALSAACLRCPNPASSRLPRAAVVTTGCKATVNRLLSADGKL